MEPGMLVVCVDDFFVSGDGGIRTGTVYTVAGYDPQEASSKSRQVDGTAGTVWLCEVDNPFGVRPEALGAFAAARFRPLRDESLSVFREALSPAPRETETA